MVVTTRRGEGVFANSRFSMPSSWERAAAFWALARIHSPRGDSNKSHPEPGQPLFQKTRDTNHETAFFHTAFPVARLVPVGTEALQSCFLRSGMLGVSREEPFLRSRDAKIRGVNVSNEKG